MSEFRKDIVTDQWVIIASERGKRPSDFSVIVEKNKQKICPFCAGFENLTPPPVYTNNDSKDDHWQVRVVPNKFPALDEHGVTSLSGDGFYSFMPGYGRHEVVIETPNHGDRMVDLSEDDLKQVFIAYRSRVVELRKKKDLQYILIFKNYGREAGATLEHSHSQLIATPIIPISVKNRISGARRFFKNNKTCVFCKIIDQEKLGRERIIAENENFLSFAPYASRVPYEVCIIPKKHQDSFHLIGDKQIAGLASIFKKTLVLFDQVLGYPPYNMILHTAPSHDDESGYYHWHIEIMPKLTTLAGFELGSGFFINPTAPEIAAQDFRQLAV